jgi:hypothetical protein
MCASGRDASIDPGFVLGGLGVPGADPESALDRSCVANRITGRARDDRHRAEVADTALDALLVAGKPVRPA